MPLCMEERSAAACETTVCGHTFCTRCLARWTATNKTCPLCRESLPVAEVERPSPPATTTLRDRVEREHAERAERHHRLVQREDQFDRYRSSVWTASGRPFEELPVVSLSEMRQLLNENRRSLGTACASASGI